MAITARVAGRINHVPAGAGAIVAELAVAGRYASGHIEFVGPGQGHRFAALKQAFNAGLIEEADRVISAEADRHNLST